MKAKIGDVLAANAPISTDTARSIVKLITSEGPELRKVLYGTGILQEGGELDISLPGKYLVHHVDIQGHLMDMLPATHAQDA